MKVECKLRSGGDMPTPQIMYVGDVVCSCIWIVHPQTSIFH